MSSFYVVKPLRGGGAKLESDLTVTVLLSACNSKGCLFMEHPVLSIEIGFSD